MFTADLGCATERRAWVAGFDNAAFSMGKQGKIEVGNRDFPQGVLDEIVVSGLAILEHERRMRSNSAIWG